MIAYSIDYQIRNKNGNHSVMIDAKNIQSAKRKIGKKHGYKDGRMIQIQYVSVVGYY